MVDGPLPKRGTLTPRVQRALDAYTALYRRATDAPALPTDEREELTDRLDGTIKRFTQQEAAAYYQQLMKWRAG